MIMAYEWGTTLGTVTIKDCIQNNLIELVNLIDGLKKEGYEYKGYNKHGIVLNTSSPILIRRDEYLYDAINSLKELIDSLLINYNHCSNDINNLKTVVDFQQNTIQNYDLKGKEITGEFFILFDFLPEEIKKQLKIYIKT